MTTETVIEKNRAELKPLDAKAERAENYILSHAGATFSNQSLGQKFGSRNISMEEYKALPRSERRRYQEEAENSNRHWIESQFESLGADWVIIIDGQIIKHGTTLSDFPGNRDIRALSQQTGKCPFVFFSKAIFAIEESSISWHRTTKANDFYPAVSITLTGYNQRYETEADLDTGALGCHGSLELLTASGVVDIGSYDLEYNALHLSQPYVYFTDEAWIELIDSAGQTRKSRTAILCVEDWQNSPFVAVNPARTILLGRRILLELQPRLTLDFAARRTEVQFVEATS